MSEEKTKSVESGCRCGRLAAIRAQLEAAKRKAEEPIEKEREALPVEKQERQAEG
jgi:hypothetical protein